jgi:PAS domain S-box-containing protein
MTNDAPKGQLSQTEFAMTAKQKILIVDDKKENLLALRKVLADMDAEIVEATSGNEALAATLKHDFAMAILDVMMPAMDGYELAEYLRGDPKTQRLPIIFLTAFSLEEQHVFEGYKVGAVDYIAKPYNPAVLRSKVAIFLELDQAHRELAEKVVALSASEERYRSLVTTIPDIVYRIDTDGRFTYLNDAVEVLGYTPEDLLGTHFSNILLPDDVERVSRHSVLPKYEGKKTGPEGAPKLFDERRTGKRKTVGLEVGLVPRIGGRAVPVELHRGGPDVVVEINSSGIYGGDPEGKQRVFLGTVGVIRDITARKKAEEELARHRDRLQELVHQRVREIQCLYSISKAIEAPFNSVDEILKEAVSLIPSGFQHPDLVCARITFEGRDFLAPNFRETQWRLSTDIPLWRSAISEQPASVLVCYLKEESDQGEGPFLEEEHRLLDEIARQLGMMLVREQTMAELRQIEWLLSKPAEVQDGVNGQQDDYVPPYGDLLTLNRSRLILDSVGRDVLTDIVNDYLKLLDTSAAVYEKNRDYALGIFSSGWCRFMDAASRALCRTDDNREALDCGRWHCHESCWADAAKVAMETGGPADIACKGGIRLYAVPIFADREIIGAINFGYGDPPRDESKLQELAAAFNVTVEELRVQARAYETRPLYIIELAKHRLAASARLIGEIVRRKRSEIREQHVNAVLRSLRDVNQLIVHEKRPEDLIQKTCNTLIRSRGLQGAWIALTNGSANHVQVAQEGLDVESFQSFADTFRAGKLPPCCRRSRDEGRAIAIPDPAGACQGCFLADAYAGNGALTIGLRYGNRQYGYLGVSVPPEFAHDEEEASLLAEVAGDITFALHSISSEAARRKSEQTVEAMFDSAQDGILLADAETRRFVRANEAMSHMLGYSPEEITGLCVDDIHPAEELPRVIGAFEKQLAGEIALAPDIPLKRKDGSVFPADVNAATLELNGRLHLLGIFRDITERKEMEAELNKFRIAVEQSADGINITDMEGTILYANRASEVMYGYRPGELVGHAVQILNHEAEISTSLIIPAVKSAGQWTGELIQKRKDGSCFTGHLSASAVQRDGRPMGMLGIIRDITERRQAEEEKKKLEIQLRQAQKMEAIGTLAGGIAHDFNNILSAIMGYTGLSLEKAPKGSSLRTNLEEVLSATGRATGLVKQILTFSRQTEKEEQTLRVELIAKEVLKLLRASLPATIEIRRDIQSDLLIMADPSQVHQVIMNLCVNAGHAMEEKGGVLEVCLADVDLDAGFTARYPGMTPGPHVKLTVSDTGHGIDGSTMERIFEPYFTTKAKGEGTGLGLSVVHGIVKGCSGAITVESEPGKGTTFLCLFPGRGIGKTAGSRCARGPSKRK